jgi:hypothetical protein
MGWESEVLELEFFDGGVYQYTRVPEAIWKELESCESKGRAFRKLIRGHYATAKIQ